MRRLVLAVLFAIPISSGAQSATDGVALFRARRYAEARSAFETAVKANGNDARAAYYLGRIALVEGNAGKAEDWLERAVKLDGRNADYHHWLGRAYSREALRAGKFRQMKLAGRIRDEFKAAVALDPDDVEARFDLLQYYLVVPGIMGGSDEKAREQAAEIRSRNPFRGHLAAGAIAEHRKDNAGAEREYTAAVTAFPDSLQGAYALASFYGRRAQWDRAFALCERLIAEQKDPVASYYFGRMASMSGQRLDRGAELLREYVQRRPDDTDPSLASAHYRLGLIYEKQGKRDLAKQEFATTVQLDPKQTEAKEGLKRVQ
jgi:tetratricopeptide (TPR) repeat protein